MKEELIRIENGVFLFEAVEYQFDLEISKGACIGVFADNHEYAGSAFEGIFSGRSQFQKGKAFVCGSRVSPEELNSWIREHAVRLNRNRFTAKESNVLDFLLYLGPDLSMEEHKALLGKLHSKEAETIKKQMGCTVSEKDKLTKLTVTEYYKLAVFRAWLWNYSIIILDRISEILPSQNLEDFMDCVQLLQGQGMGCIMLELNEDFMYRYASRVDVIRNRKVCYRLEPEEYDERLYRILGWRYSKGSSEERQEEDDSDKEEAFRAENLLFSGKEPLNCSIHKGEIALFRDEHLELVPILKKCIFEKENWISGDLYLDGKCCTPAALRKKIGKEIGIQTERPDRKGGILFDNLSGLENLYDSLIPKSGRKLILKNSVNSILHTAEKVFSKELLLTPVGRWSYPDRLKLIYYRWYLINPRLLICMMPFSGQETPYHEMIIEMLVNCARRGMAILLVSSGVDGIYEKTENQEFRKRLKVL